MFAIKRFSMYKTIFALLKNWYIFYEQNEYGNTIFYSSTNFDLGKWISTL